MLTEVRSTKSETRVYKSLIYIESSVKIPLFVPSLNNTIVELQLQIVSGLDLSVKRSALREVEPEFELVGEFKPSFIAFDVRLEVEGAVGPFGVDFPGEELVMDKVVSEDGICLFGEVCPGVDFDAFRFRHSDLN